MTHPIVALQAALAAAWHETLAVPVIDAPRQGQAPPYAAIVRHDLRPRDGDIAPGNDHRLLIHIWADAPSRKAALEIADALIAAALAAQSNELKITLGRHERTETTIDAATGKARAAVTLTFFTEPN